MALKTQLVVWAMIVAATVSGCDRQESPTTHSSPSTALGGQRTTASAPPATSVVQFDPQWMTLETLPSWEESTRDVTRDFQQFGMRPVDENEYPRNCNGCGVTPPTAFLTAYAPGGFDPAQARTGEPVKVNTDGDGFFRASRDSEDSVLAWEYAADAWATIRGRTTITNDPARLTELARALRPTERSAIRLPLGMPGLPESLPLVEISADRETYGTRLRFGACGRTDRGAVSDCDRDADRMYVQIWPTDGYYGHIAEQKSVPVQIGGRDGLYEAASNRAAVQVHPGVLVVFEMDGPYAEPGQPRPKPRADLKEILTQVEWAANPGDEQTWLAVADWVRQE